MIKYHAQETRRKRLERLLTLLIMAKTGYVDAVLLRKNKPEVDVVIVIGGILTGHKVSVQHGFKKDVDKAIKHNVPGQWAKIVEKVFNLIVKEYGDEFQKNGNRRKN